MSKVLKSFYSKVLNRVSGYPDTISVNFKELKLKLKLKLELGLELELSRVSKFKFTYDPDTFLKKYLTKAQRAQRSRKEFPRTESVNRQMKDAKNLLFKSQILFHP